jgi:predicted DNA-binding transcriptional regulator YafY
MVSLKGGGIMAENKKNRGLQLNQKMKSYLVLDLLQKETDCNHVLDAFEIAEKIKGTYKISAERRSVYRDIDAINAVLLIARGDVKNIKKANTMVEGGETTIVYDATKKGYYYDNIFFDYEDVRIAAECIYAAKFIDEDRAERIVEEIICKGISKYQKKEIKRDIFVSDRVRTNKTLYRTIETITEAMRHRTENDEFDKKKYKHRPEQISFQYLTHTLGNVENEIERGKGKEYVVSPYRLMVCDGNYYLLAYNANLKKNKVRTYRVDRMRNVKRIKDSEREGWTEIQEIDLETYTQTHFNMFEGDSELVTIRFTNDLLDAIIDRFGTKNARYYACDKGHFTVTTRVNLSNPFYGWVFAFGNKAKIINPPKAIDEFSSLITSLSGMYSPDETK